MADIIFETSDGPVQGWRDGNVIRATGIPYAMAGRYEKPRETGLPQIPYPATKWSPACPQNLSRKSRGLLGRDMLERLTIDENCQYLSITLPDSAPPPSGRPVMVWIYGGSYASGAGDSPVYNPTLLVEENDVIVVNINYRLGLLGFLGGYNDVPANLGLLDIMAALRWIKKHIAAFGGNPANITLFGQSAGGDAIAHLMLIEGTEDLFHRAIIQSAPLGIRKGKAAMARKMIKKVAMLPEDTDVDTLLALQSRLILSMKGFGIKGGMPFGIQYGYPPVPPEKDVEKIWRERARLWDVMIGWTDRETSLFVPFVKPLRSLSVVPFMGRSSLEWLIRKTTDRIYRNPGKTFARHLAGAGGSVYQYHISWGAGNNWIKAAHIVDISLLFGTRELWKTSVFREGKSLAELQQAGKEIRAIWTTFARTGVLETKRYIPGLIEYHQVKDNKK